jgi:hypothetical protein
MSSGRVKHGEQIPINKIFSKRFVRIGNCVRIIFMTTLKIAGKYDFFNFCKPYISSRSHPTQEIFYIQTLGGCPYKLTKFEVMLWGGTPPPKELSWFRSFKMSRRG